MNNVLTVLSVLLKKAVEWDVIAKVPCTIRLVRAPKPSMGFYDFDEYERLLEAGKASDVHSAIGMARTRDRTEGRPVAMCADDRSTGVGRARLH